MILRLATGLVAGGLVGPVDVVGRPFILQLQMTVLSSVSVPLGVGLCSLRVEGVAVLALRAGLGLPVSWSTAFVVIFTMSLWSSDRESASHCGSTCRRVAAKPR